MKNQQRREVFQKGLIFSLLIIFVLAIGFHEIAAALVSRIFGVSVRRGSVAELQYMLYFFGLYAFITGWANIRKEGTWQQKFLQGLLTSVVAGFVVALFDLLLVFLVNNSIDIRQYLTAFSIPSMSYFLFEKGAAGPLYHLGYFIVFGGIGAMLHTLWISDTAQQVFGKIRNSLQTVFSKTNDAMPPFLRKYGKYFLLAVTAIVLYILPRLWGSYINFVVGLVGLYVIAGIGLNIIVGLSGQLMLGYAAFFAMGAYSVALLNAPIPHNILLGFWPSILIAIAIAVLAGMLLGLPLMGLRGDYLAIVTLGFGEIIRILLKSDLLENLTGGPRGINDIKGPTLFGQPFSNDIQFMYIIFVAVALTIFIYQRLQDSRTGRAWLSIKEDAIAAQATGVNLKKYKLLALCIGAAFAGLAGGIAAARNQFTGPNDHSLLVSMNVLSIVIVGGVNSIPGIILGAFTLKGLPEILREVENYRQLAFGALLIVMMIKRPNGLWPASRPLYEKSDCLEDGTKNTGMEKKND
jgi:ABC-type branched-subunit amino acid transport system permease subunit